MRFEVSERISTGLNETQLVDVLQQQFKKIAYKVERNGNTLKVTSIEATFGSANRTDITEVSLKEMEDGYLAVACVMYRPSIFFWILFAALLFGSVIGFFVPIAFYIYQQKSVRSAIEAVFNRVKNEFTEQRSKRPIRTPAPEVGALEQLEKLGHLKEKGLITDAEFISKKKQLLEL